jgi:hypothetical protein
VDCWFEIAVGWWSDWTCTVPILVVDTLAVSASQVWVLLVIHLNGCSPVVYVQRVYGHGVATEVLDRV